MRYNITDQVLVFWSGFGRQDSILSYIRKLTFGR